MKIGNLEVYGVIYKITNLINGKVYIGQTTRNKGINDRYQRKGVGVERVYSYHKDLRKNNFDYNSHLLNSFEKYGIENFVMSDIFDIAFSKEELDIKERMYIRLYNSFKNGYNRNLGGNGNKGHESKKGGDSPFSKKVVQLDLNGNYIKTWDSLSDIYHELNINKSDVCSACNGKHKSAGGYLWVFEEDYDKNKEYIYVNRTGEYNKKQIVKLSLSGEYIKEYSSISEAIKELGETNASKIASCCKGKRKSHKGFMWMYKDEYENKKDNVKPYSAKNKGVKTKIVQISLDGEIIKIRDSMSEVERQLGISTSKISGVCKGKRKTTGGYKWKYYDEAV